MNTKSKKKVQRKITAGEFFEYLQAKLARRDGLLDILWDVEMAAENLAAIAEEKYEKADDEAREKARGLNTRKLQQLRDRYDRAEELFSDAQEVINAAQKCQKRRDERAARRAMKTVNKILNSK